MRQQVIDNFVKAIISASNVSSDVKKILKDHNVKYINNDDYDADGMNEYGYNKGKEIGTCSPHWDTNNKLDQKELIDTIFHEAQHDRKNNSRHGKKFRKDVAKEIMNSGFWITIKMKSAFSTLAVKF